eukprot:scaffold3020_cov118-Cylindrotheca_fusiformis.AAC.4
MVSVKLPPRRTVKSRIVSVRNVILAGLALLSFRFMFSSQHISGSPNNLSAGSRPLGLEEMLKDSKKGIALLEHAVDFHQGSSNDDKNRRIPPQPNRKTDILSVVVEKKGTGPTNIAYAKDFADEREHPAIKTAIENTEDVTKTVSDLMGGASVKPCRVPKDDGFYFDSRCTYPDSTIVAYNAAWFHRTWCGQEIKPRTAVTMTEHCADHIVYLSEIDPPPLSGQDTEPVIIRSQNKGIVDARDLETIECNIKCMQEKDMQGSQRFVDGEPWSITYTDDDAFANGHARIERLAYRRDHFYSTQSFTSAVPHTFFDWSKYNLREHPALDWATAKAKAVYLVDSKCSGHDSRRHRYFGAIAEVLAVDSYGSCAHNTDLADGMTLETSEGRIAIMKRYRIVLAFDAGTDKDHISPMIWDALISGAVPVIVGAENMKSHLPSDSFVWSGNFHSWNELAVYVKQLVEDEKKWNFYQAWRNNETSLSLFEAKYDFARVSTVCRLCRWAYATKHGLGWSQEKQTVVEPNALRKLCTSQSTALILKPFAETWLSRLDKKDSMFHADQTDHEECNSMMADSKIEARDFRIRRVAAMHDGVTDIIVKEVDRDDEQRNILLVLTFGVENFDGAYFENTHALTPTSRPHGVSSLSIQDGSVKVTVLSDWVTRISSPTKGSVEILIQKSSEAPVGKEYPKRIRIIHEDFDSKNDKVTEFYPSVFCKKMIQDFVDPLDLFYNSS